MKKQIMAIAAIAASGFISNATAQAQDIKVSGKVFFDYGSGKTTTGGVDSKTSGGDISRTYVTAKSKINDTWSANVTFDSSLDPATKKKNNVFLKTAQLTGKFSDTLNVKLGMIGTPWIGYEDGLNGHRHVSKSFVDTQGMDSSADAGIGAFGKALDGFLSYDVVSVNGGGYGNTTRTEKTDLNLRIGLDVIENLTVDIGYRNGYRGTFATTKTKHTLTQTMVTYGQEVNGLSYRAGLNLISNKANDQLASTTVTQKGQELWVWARQGDVGAYLRNETYDDGKAGSAKEKRTVLSLDYYAAKGTIFSLVSDSTKNAGNTSGNKASKTGLFAQFAF